MSSPPIEAIRGVVSRVGQAFDRLPISRAFSRFSLALHVIVAGGHPVYEAQRALEGKLPAGDNEALWPLVINQAALPAAPSSTDRGLGTAGFAAFRFFWRNVDGAAPTSLSFRLWAHIGPDLGWVRIGDHALIQQDQEVRVDVGGGRRVWFQVTAADGGNQTCRVYVGGEA